MLSNDTITLNTHNLITGCLRQFLDTGREIFSIYVIFPVQSSGLVQIFKFYCANLMKMKKKTKLPGKTSWKVSIWHFVLYELVFNRKIQFATLKILVAFFSPKSFKPIFSGSVCWILDFFGLNKQNHQKTILFQVSTVLFWLVFASHALLFADRRSGALAQKGIKQL